MVLWLIGVAVFVLLWAALWKTNPRAAFGAVIGFVLALIVAWVFSSQLTNYVTHMNEIPVWVPPLPFALVVVTLFYFGIRTWLNADNLPPPRARPDDHEHEHH
jgi:ABC-type sulfate transport system permease component